MLGASAGPLSELQTEIRIIANIFNALIAVMLTIKFVGDCITLASSTSVFGSTHDKSWALKGMLKTILFLMLDGGAWALTNFIIYLSLVM